MNSSRNALLFSCVVVGCMLASVGCGGQGSAPSESAPEATAEPSVADREAALAEREKEIELREKEQELADREAALEQKQQAPATQPKPQAPKPATQAKPAPAKEAAPAPTPKPTPRPDVVVHIPAGTEIAVQLTTPLSTKTAAVGDEVSAFLAEDLVIDGRHVANAGAPLHGTVASVVSAKKKIGGRAKLGLAFDRIELASGATAGIAAASLQEGKSSTGQDAAKIGGGAAAGAILGHQIDDDKGKVIGGIIGGALGTLAASKTGAELELPVDTVITVAIEEETEVRLPG